MKTKFTIKSRMLAKALFGVSLLFCGTAAKAQAPFQGGQTYWVDGFGVDSVLPKDTFINLNGAYVANAAYTNNTGLITALTNQGVDPVTVGTVNIVLAATYGGTEVGTINIGQTTNGGYPFMSVQRPVVIKPEPGANITITSSTAIAANSALVRFNGAQFVTIDGESTSGERNLSFVMPAGSSAGTSKVLDIIAFANTGCQQLTIKNCNFKGLSTAGANASIGTYAGVYLGGVTSPSAPLRTAQNISIINNVFEAIQNPIYIRGRETAIGQQDNNLIVRNNICGGTIEPIAGEVLPTTFIGGGTNSAGITLIGQKNAIVEGNVICNNLPSAGNFRGITLVSTAQVALDSNITINANKIYNLSSKAPSTGVYGIRIGLGSHSQPLGISVTNNTIAKLSSTTGGIASNTLAYPVGIAIEDVSFNAGINIYHNSVHLYGDTMSAGSLSACLYTGSSTNGGVRVANNIFVNRMGRTLNSTGTTATAYIYITNTNVRPFSYMRNNAYYVNNTTGSYSFIGYFRSKAWPSLTNWRVVMPDTGSIMSLPPFVGVNDTTLTIPDLSATTLGAYGVSQGVSLDMNGDPRSPSTPSLGAYEFTGNAATAYYALAAGSTYLIDGSSNWPVGAGGTGSFESLADAVTYLNTFGVTGTGTVTLQFSSGYIGESNLIPAITLTQGVSATTNVLIRSTAGESYTISNPALTSINNQYALIRMIGARYITIDGQSVAGQRNLTFSLDSSLIANTLKVISIASGDSATTTNITIKNCNITGAARVNAINTAFGIYQGHYYPTSAFQSSKIGANNNIVLTNNYIVAVRTGIYLRGSGLPNGQNRNITINRNVIGGDEKRGSGLPMTYVGSVADQAGIYLKGIANATVDSNVVRNSDSVTAGSGFRGIDLDLGGDPNGVDSFISITRNTIYNLTTAGAYAAGIRVSLGANGNRRISIVNNTISKIQGRGVSPSANPNNPAGIIVDGSGAVGDLNMDIYHNTIQMLGTSMIGSNVSYCVYFGGAIQGGVRMQGNLLSNKLGRTSALNGNAYAIFTNTTVAANPFRVSTGGFINSNSYGTDALNTNKAILGVSTTSYNLVAQWQTALGQDYNSYFFVPYFENDSTPSLDPIYAGPLYNGSLTVPSVPADIAGTPRTAPYTCMGALMFAIDYLPLAGNTTYRINGVNNFPRATGSTPPYSFATINTAIKYVNANGVDAITPTPQPITLLIDTGYIGEGDTLISPLQIYPRMNSSRIITLTNAPGRSDTIRTGVEQSYLANGSVFRFNGGSYFVIDGSSNGTSTGRNITFTFPVNTSTNTIANNLKLIDVTSGERVVTNIGIKNCNFIGNVNGGTINTFAAIYVGGVAATPSAPILSGANNINISNNAIGGVRYGIYAQGATAGLGQQDKSLVVRGNYIGKDTVGLSYQFGGAAGVAGIYLNAQANAIIDSNVITNNVTGATFSANKGIELAATGSLSIDSNISITRNTIVKIKHIGLGAAYGVYINLAGDSMARITLANNMISGISSQGTATTGALSTASPFGVFVDATGSINTLGLNIYYNSINMGSGSSLGTTNNAVSACLAFGSNIKGGVALRNNILQNRLGRTSGSGWAYSLFVGHSSNIFTVSDNNSYFADAPNVESTNQGIALLSATATTRVKYNTYAEWSNLTKQDSMSIVFATNFVNDTNLALNGPQHLVYGWGFPVTGVTNDMHGQARSSLQPTIGADELSPGVYADSTAPRIYNITKAPLTCINGPFDIFYRVFERANSTVGVQSDTLYYKLNDGPEQFVVGATFVNGFLRMYRIPAQPVNTAIAYRLSVNDKGSLNGISPANGKYDYTSSTFNMFPIAYGFDGANPGFTIVSQGPGGPNTLADGGWDLESFGSPLDPVVTPNTGIRAALFPSSTLPKGTMSRIVSPCLDFTGMKVPTLRIWVSQNGESPTTNDVVQVRISGGSNFWSIPLATVSRYSPGLAFPQFKQIDVCLSAYAGAGYKIGIDGVSASGQNIVLDSIVIFDDVLSDVISPLTTTICEYNPLSVNLPSSSPSYTYTLADAFTGNVLGDAVTGTGSAMAVTAPNPSNPYIGRVDSVYAVVRYMNIRSGCTSYLPDTSKIKIKSFYGGPYMTEGTPFNGSFNAGTEPTPDGVTFGDTATYELVPPSGMSNLDYNIGWTVAAFNVQSPSSSFTIVNDTYTAPVGSTNGNYRLIPSLSEVDSLFKVSVTYRLLPSNCDSVVVRYLKVTSAPVANFTVASDSTCPGVSFYMTNTTTFLPYTAPITYLWEFGDGTIATTKDANKTYPYTAAPGLYIVKMTAFNNAGVSSTAIDTIRLLEAPYSAFVSGQACGKDSIQFTSNATGATSYWWTSKLGNVTMASSALENPKFSFGMSDTLYDVTLRATNDLGCFKDTTIGTFSFSKPLAAFTTTNGCLGLNAQFTNNTTIAPGINGRVNTFGSEWDFGNGESGLSNTAYKYPESGTYTVTLKATSNYGCVDSAQQMITVYDKPNVGFTTGVGCLEQVVAITNTTTYAGGADKVIYHWNFGDLSPASTEFQPVKSYTSAATFTILLIAQDTVHNCSDTAQKVIEVNELPTALFVASKGCINSPVSFNNGSLPPSGQTMTYVWDFDGEHTDTATNPTYIFALPGDKMVSLTATTNKGCSDSETQTVKVENVPTATFDIDSIDCNTRKFRPHVAGLSAYHWDYGDQTSQFAPIGENTYQFKNKYYVTLTVTSPNQCQASHTDSVTIPCTIGFEEEFANKFNLSVYPNPFEEVSNIGYNLDSKKDVTITVMDILGRVVSEVSEKGQSAGNHTIRLDESKFSATSAIYMVRIQIGDEAITKQLIRK